MGGVGPEIVDFCPLPGPTRPRGGFGKAPAGRPRSICTDFQPGRPILKPFRETHPQKSGQNTVRSSDTAKPGCLFDGLCIERGPNIFGFGHRNGPSRCQHPPRKVCSPAIRLPPARPQPVRPPARPPAGAEETTGFNCCLPALTGLNCCFPVPEPDPKEARRASHGALNRQT